LSYPFNPNQVVQNLHHLGRLGLISADWQNRTIQQEQPLKEYVKKNVVESEMWPNALEDWLKIDKALQDKYGKVNMEY